MAAMASDKADGQTQWEFSCDLEVDYESEEIASIVYATLAVDKELQPDKVKRQMLVSNGKLSVKVEAFVITAKDLRTIVAKCEMYWPFDYDAEKDEGADQVPPPVQFQRATDGGENSPWKN